MKELKRPIFDKRTMFFHGSVRIADLMLSLKRQALYPVLVELSDRETWE